MGWQIVKNPETEGYQIFSSIVDAFLLDDELSRDEMDEFWLNQFGAKGQDNYKKIMAELDKPNGKPYDKLTMTWKEAKMWDTHQAEHGIKNRQPDTCGICADIKKDDANG